MRKRQNNKFKNNKKIMKWLKEKGIESKELDRIQSRVDVLKQRTVDHIDNEMHLYKREKQLEIENEMVTEKNRILEFLKQGQKEMTNYEHEYHSYKEEKGVTLARLNADIECKKQTLASMDNIGEIKLKAAIDSKDAIIAGKDGVIKLLTDQVEILTAKLTEIKITDAHINIDCDSLLAKAMESKK